ncbi:MAG: beta,4-mannosyltransferase [Pseudonocardiales bacterium]|nr:beta,4-mannosyltransferase [Pseudonocardiales bacterium]
MFAVAMFSSLVLWPTRGPTGITGWATTFLWSLPTLGMALGIFGALRTRLRLRRAPTGPVPPAPERLIVVIPTIGRIDTLPALRRVVHSCAHLAPFFPDRSIEILIEEGCAGAAEIAGLAALPATSVVTVPHDYTTPNGTQFKARANQYALTLRPADPDLWVLHLDDDTAIGPDTAQELARFVHAQRDAGPAAKHLAQGVLTYPRELGASRLLWLADAIRPAGDVSTFAATTGTGTPRAGLHGELLLVRASVEAEIGWDFGPRTMVEDARFALELVARHPGSTDWFPGRCFGATPATVAAFVVQRERWAWGLMELAWSRAVPLRHRLLLLHNVTVWAFVPLQHVGVVLGIGWLIGDMNTLPAVAWLQPIWAANLAYSVWCYRVGLTLNAKASCEDKPRWWEHVAVVAGIPVFSILEAVGVARGVVRFIRRDASAFPVIAKPR